MPRIQILGIPIDVLTAREALMEIGSFFKREGQFHIATPNPEMLVETRRNGEFRTALQGTALNLPDGIGLVWAMKRARPIRTGSFGRVTGTDMVEALLSREARICPPERVFLLGAAPGIAEHAAARLRETNPALQIAGTFAGSPDPTHDEEIVARINAAALAPHSSSRSDGGPTLLFVAFGAPAQDLWIARNLQKLRTVKVAMGVGGAFDFIAGKQKRAPRFLRALGLEWLWRLLLQPRRVKRIFRAVIVFPWLALKEKWRCHEPERTR